MKSFITNVRLKNADTGDYDRLDVEMEKERFAKGDLAGGRQVDSGREYNFLGQLTLQAVTEAAYRAAHRTGKQYTFTVIKLRS